jgi:hypothetical protein
MHTVKGLIIKERSACQNRRIILFHCTVIIKSHEITLHTELKYETSEKANLRNKDRKII